MSWTLPYMRNRLYECKDFGARILGFAGTATSRDANGITDPIRFGGANLGEFQFQDGWFRVPHLADATGRVKRAGALLASALLHDDNDDWAAPFTGLNYEWTTHGVHPDQLDECVLNALRHVYLYNYLPETPWPDGNFEAADLDSFVGVNANVAKLSDQVYGLTGSRSLVVTNTAANGYAASTAGIFVQPGQSLQLNALGLNVSGAGPLYWRLYDFTGGVWGTEITPAAVGYGYTPIHFQRDVTVPQNCYRINCRMEHASNGGIHAWDALPGRNYASRRFALASYESAGFNITGLAEAQYGENLSTGTNAQDAASKFYASWRVGPDYDTEHLEGNSSPNTLRINRDPHRVGNAELWYSSRRTWWDVQPIDETTPSDAPEELVFAYAAANVCDLLDLDGSDQYWAGVHSRYMGQVTAQTRARPQATPPARPQRIGGRLGPRR